MMTTPRIREEKGDANPCGRWRRGSDVCGRVIGVTLPDGTVGGDPAAPALASQGLRCHLRHWVLKLGGRRAAAPEE